VRAGASIHLCGRFRRPPAGGSCTGTLVAALDVTPASVKDRSSVRVRLPPSHVLLRSGLSRGLDYVFNEWWGGEWWGLLLAIAAAIPVGIVFSILPSILFGTLGRLPLVNDALLAWVFIVAGIALGVYALIGFEGSTLAMVSLTGPEIFVSGIGLLYMRLNAMRFQAAMGEASADDAGTRQTPTTSNRRHESPFHSVYVDP
jgi:hypothetical protein